MEKTNVNKLIDAKIEALQNSLIGYKKNEILVTSSLDKDSSVLLYFLQEAGIDAEILFINTGLIKGKVDENLEIFNDTFNFNLNVIDKKEELIKHLGNKDFLDLSEVDQQKICKIQKES